MGTEYSKNYMIKHMVLVALVNYNNASLTEECIRSVNQSTKEVDIFVLDNASDGNDIDAVCDKFENVILEKSQENLGFAEGTNRGIEYAINNNYEYIMLLNNDTIIDDHMVEILLNNSNDNQIAVPCMYYYDEPDRIWYGGGGINKYKGTAFHRYQGKKVTDLEACYCDFATGCCFMMTTTAAKSLGNLDSSLFMYCEDVDYSIRLIREGIGILFIPTAKLWHKVGSSSGDDGSPICSYYGSRNRLYVIDRYPDVFLRSAKAYTLFTRYAHALISALRRQETGKYYIKAIKDYRNNIKGYVELQ